MIRNIFGRFSTTRDLKLKNLKVLSFSIPAIERQRHKRMVYL